MAEWFVERGIAESRAVRIKRDQIVEARIEWPGELVAGSVVEAVLASRGGGSSRGTARLANGDEIVVDRLPRDAAEGATVRLEITRSAIGEKGRLKRAQARLTGAEPRRETLESILERRFHEVRVVSRFPACHWDDLIGEALARQVDFAGGSLLLAPTPAMLLIDIDGDLAPRQLANAAVPALAAALARFDIGGVVGIDFPTLTGKGDRKAVDLALGEALGDWPHERTAMNGFGFVQLVSRLERPSIVHRAATSRTGLVARQLLRRAEGLEGAGATLLTCHPAIRAKLKDEWLSELARRTAREVRVESDPALALEAPHAQLVPR